MIRRLKDFRLKLDLYYYFRPMEKRKEKSEILYAMFVYGGVIWWWSAMLWVLIRFIIDGIKYFS